MSASGVNLLQYLGIATVLVVAVRVLLREPARPQAIRRFAFVAALLAIGWAIATYSGVPYDFKRFWRVGLDIRSGLNYYGLDPRGGRQLILNPPTVLPLYLLWSLIPLRESAGIWAAGNTLAVMGLVPLAHAAMRAQIGPRAPRLPRATLSILAAGMLVSCSHGMGMALGQVSVLAAAAILSSLWAQGRGRPALAGALLAIATIKANTALPFTMLFLRRRDLPFWPALAGTCLLLCLLTSPVSELPNRVTRTMETIRLTFEPGAVNDYSFGSPSHASLVGFDHALYRLGLRDRLTIARLQLLAIAALGGLLLLAILSGRLPRGAACALTALYASLFLYHRIYDLFVLMPALVYSALIATAVTVRRGTVPRTASVLCLLALFINPEGLLSIEEWSMSLPDGPAQAIVWSLLAPGVWLIVMTAVLLVADLALCREVEEGANAPPRSAAPPEGPVAGPHRSRTSEAPHLDQTERSRPSIFSSRWTWGRKSSMS